MSVPKAAVDKDDLAATDKDDVRCAWQLGSMQPKPVSHGKK
jgi:hypothetical protein